MKIFAYVISALIGFAISHYFLEGAAAAFASVLISYHLYLLFLVLTADHEKGFSMPIGQTILTHSAFLVVVVGLPFLREQIPFFFAIKWLIPALAPFETTWLFGGKGPIIKTADEPRPSGPVTATAQDHQDFVVYLRQKNRPFKKPGMTVDEEFQAWLADRARNRVPSPAMTSALPEPAEPGE